jgi:guanyl-specific ribonuclease Sa
VRGLQSAGVNTRFNLEQVFEIGQLAIYENLENLPDVEVTCEKVLDGYPLIYHLATQDAPASTLVGRSNQKCHVALSIFLDTVSLASGAPLSQCIMSGMFVNQVGYDITVDGNARETCTLIGNNKVWSLSGFVFSGFISGHGVTSLSPAAASGVNRRQDLIMASSRWPTQIPGITASGTNNPNDPSGYTVHIQSVRTSANLGREQMLELGRNGPYFRYVQFPVEVSTTIDIMDQKGDLISATEDGIFGNGVNLIDQTIKVYMNEGLVLDMGTKNKLASVGMTGGDAGARGNTTVSFAYTNFNDLDVKHSADPTVALRP